MEIARTMIPAIRFTGSGDDWRNAAIMRRADLAKLDRLRESWEYNRRTNRTSPDYPHGDITNHAESLRRAINGEWKRITNEGQFCRIYNIDNAHDVIRIIIAWAESRIAFAEYTLDDYHAVFHDDPAGAERAYLSSLFA